jgi:hypothetical protein
MSGLPFDIQWCGRVADDLDPVGIQAEQARSGAAGGLQSRHRLALLGDQDRFAAARDLIHQLEALGLEFRRRHGTHCRTFPLMTMVMTMVLLVSL